MTNKTADLAREIQERDNGKLFRTVSIRAEDIDDDRRVEMSVSSEEPVDRWFGTEILVHETKAIDLKFMKSGSAPLLLDHDHRKQIGVIEKVSLDDTTRKLRATVRFGKSPLAEEILNDVKDGIRSNISIGYVIEKIERDTKTDEVRVIRWSPFETSIVSVPADTTVGIGRGVQLVETAIKPMERQMAENTENAEPKVTAPAAPLAQTERGGVIGWETRDAEIRSARQETADILDLGARHNMSDKANEHVRSGKSLNDFRAHVLANLPAGTELVSRDIGLTAKETRNFSVMRLARGSNPAASKAERDAAAFEFEAISAAADVAERSGLKTRGAQMPAEVLREWIPRNSSEFALRYASRAIAAGVDTALVPEDYRPGSFIDVLRNNTSILRAGATMLQGLAGNVDIPKKLTASGATWVATEGADASESEPTFGSIALTPRDLAVFTDITRRARQQMNPDIEALIRSDITMAIALGIDLGGLEGSGAAGQPTGVRNVVGINRPAPFAAANPTYAEVVALETEVANDNALMGNMAYIVRSSMKGAMKTTEKFASTGQTVWEPGDTLNGYPALVSNQGTAGNLYFGNWSDVLIGMWGTLDINFDYAALAKSGGLRIIAFQTVDVAVRHASSFAWNKFGA